MYYYILAKRHKFIAIAADHHLYQYHLTQGYVFVSKVRAWNEKSALMAVKHQLPFFQRVLPKLQGIVLFILLLLIIA
ncbi:hypothetical protein [Pseudoalteromonas tunicata]|jgi:hypothetical protein|uniref:Uncharacterized protein n=1 Tax=Pseudoalteromonas tunicata D2 TaxID=87626 RepID=A4C3S7_9GAMM|nr:hypothetical protein [Pseudoalteromonas tunicata]ATC96513.1 hypothetical protein PTUN_b0040 [Pseudoalteromonas tunicata]AXT33383.1 hypothetical protein D1819_21555 [Pseudoalteromonas tunicata]EAR30209.1 hypothetical protein PTD2_01531 [Pseudoalteromonas tunicata D2]